MPNQLASEKSPYLLQHANNPVHWYPWSEEAFLKAKEEDKPIFLSIGYSTCHWCHVMEHESFENAGIAAYLNEHFISIKVDREERPDVDAIYMSATQAMTGSGGWPMTCFLTPELKPFFCGTYYPPIPSYGRPSFPQLLERITELWQTRRNDIVASAAELTKAISEQRIEAPTITSIESASENCFEYFKRAFDSIEGGFGAAPKFPRPSQFEFLFNHYDISKNDEARKMALFTLKKMAFGGINDQLSGGFHRYSVDAQWFASHFEKMLYDQAQLLESYIDAYQVTHDEFYKEVAGTIADFISSDMTHPEGGFYSAYDADSEGVEGKYYVWTYDEIEHILGAEEAALFAYRYGITREGNWEHGNNILYRDHTTPDAAKHFSLDVEIVRSRLDESRKKLLAERKRRIPPHLDDKILTSWNGLMISALARYAAFDSKYLAAAVASAEFIWTELHEKTGGQLFHRWRDGEAKFPAYLDSYAFLIKGYLRLYEATFDAIWLERAIRLQAEQDEIFYDRDLGGYFSSREQADLIVRTKNDYDGAEPSGNSIALQNIFRLFELTSNEEYKTKALETIKFFSGRLAQFPYTMPSLLLAALWQSNPPAEIVIAGERDSAEFNKMKGALSINYLPRSIVMYADSSNTQLSEFARSLQTGTVTAYYCHNFTCDRPVHTAEELKALLP